MKYLRVRNVTRNVELGQKVRVAATLMERAVGLLATASLSPGEGLWLSPCKSIHTCLMRYPIDILFLDAQGNVLNQKTYSPWRISGYYVKSHGALELAAGTLKRTGTRIGDQIELKDVN